MDGSISRIPSSTCALKGRWPLGDAIGSGSLAGLPWGCGVAAVDTAGGVRARWPRADLLPDVADAIDDDRERASCGGAPSSASTSCGCLCFSWYRRLSLRLQVYVQNRQANGRTPECVLSWRSSSLCQRHVYEHDPQRNTAEAVEMLRWL